MIGPKHYPEHSAQDYYRTFIPELFTMPTDFAAVRKYAARAFRILREEWQYRHAHPSHAAAEAIRRTGKHFGIGFGCEGFTLDAGGRHGISYLNMGDTYDTTIIFDSRTCRFTVGCWGDVVERLERQGITIS